MLYNTWKRYLLRAVCTLHQYQKQQPSRRGIETFGLLKRRASNVTHEVSNVRTTSRDGSVFRTAELSDLDGICHCSRLAFKDHYKLDYLPGWFPRVLQDKNRITCVVEKDNQIIGYMMGLHGVDNGKTILLEAGRSHPDVDGTGQMGRSISWVVSRCAQIAPQYERVRGSSMITDYYHKNPGRVDILSSRKTFEVHLPGDKLSTSPLCVEFLADIQRLSRENFRQVLGSETTLRNLFPKDVIVVGYNIFEPIVSNVPFITYFHDRIYIGSDEKSISIGGKYPCNDGRSWRYNFNYSGRVDVATCQAHLAEHLRERVCEQEGKDMYIIVSLPDSFLNLFGTDAVYNSLEELLEISRDQISMRSHYHYQWL